ncbi:MAG: cyclase family protein [Gaiellales bacterium]
MTLPRYRDLPRADPIDAAHAWDVFGRDDELGRVNLITPQTVAAAGAEVQAGRVFNVCLPLNLPDPPWEHSRGALRHEVLVVDRNTQDDVIRDFYPQTSTQWDGLRHVRARELGFYGGRGDDTAGPGGGELGIERWVEHGIAGRGVVADVAAHLERQGRPLDARVGTPIMVADLQATLHGAGVELRDGDILLVRTGYLTAYKAASEAERADFAVNRDGPGLFAGEEMAEFLWDAGVAVVATDNPAVEVVPGSKEAGSLHRRLIPLLGFLLGELFDLDALAADCAADGRYTCFFVAAPLNVPGGVGSPGNAVAIK